MTGGDWTPPAERLAARRQRLTHHGHVRTPVACAAEGQGTAPGRPDARPLPRPPGPIHPAQVRGRRTEAHHPESVAQWYDTAAADRPTYQAHAYSLLRAIMRTAADPTKNNGTPLIPYNPCGISGGGSSGGKRKIKPATVEEIVTIVQNMPDKHRLMVILADSCALRFGELAELRRMDVDTKNAVIHVRRGVVRSKSAGVVAKAPKSEAGIRDVPIPPDILEAVVEHRKEHAAPGPQGLMFPGAAGGHLSPSAFYGKVSKKRRGKPDTTGWGWYEARRLAGRDDLRFHDLRHGALTEAARHGATLAELMALGGHSTSQAAMRYQQAASDRLAELARKRAEARGWSPPP